MAILYVVILAGYIVNLVGSWFYVRRFVGGGAGVLARLLAVVLFALGSVAILIGLIGIGYKVIADATKHSKT